MQSGYKPHAKKYVKSIVSVFDCIREKSLAKLLGIIDNVEHLDTIIKDLDYNTTITVKDINGDRFILRDDFTMFNEEHAYCFDAFADLILSIREVEKSKGIRLPEWMDDSEYERVSHIKKGEFPYDYVFSYDNAIYLITAFGINANRKLQFHNRTVKEMLDANDKMEVPVFYVFVPVIAKKYSNISLGDEYKCNTLVARLSGADGDTTFEKHVAPKKK